METNRYLTEYYSSHDEDARLTSRHGQVEYLTTMRYIEKYLRPGMRILEIGTGTGRYAHALARMGYTVDAVELIESNIDVFKRNTQPGEMISIVQGNALDLSGFADKSYDITLLLGPLYHLYDAAEQKQALCEALRVTKSGGILFCAYCISDSTILQYCFGRGTLFEMIDKGLIDTETFKAYSTPAELFQLYRKEDIDALIEELPMDRLHYVAADLATMYMPETVDGLTDEMFEMYMKYHFAICERPDMMGLTNHSLDIARKR